MTKNIGKPYSGKLNVRFDEGELEIELLATTPVPYSTEREKFGDEKEIFRRNLPRKVGLIISRRKSMNLNIIWVVV